MSNPTGAANEPRSDQQQAGEASSSAAGETSGTAGGAVSSSNSKAGEVSSSTASSSAADKGKAPAEEPKEEAPREWPWQGIVKALLHRHIEKLAPQYGRIIRAVDGFVDPDPLEELARQATKDDLEILRRMFEDNKLTKARYEKKREEALKKAKAKKAAEKAAKKAAEAAAGPSSTDEAAVAEEALAGDGE